MTHQCRMGWQHAAQLIADEHPIGKKVAEAIRPRPAAFVEFEKGVHWPKGWTATELQEPAKEKYDEFARYLADPSSATVDAAMIGFKQEPQPDPDGWISWPGGKCPIPDAKAGEYEVRWCDGDVRRYDIDAIKIHPGHWMKKDAIFIVAYRLLKPTPPTESPWLPCSEDMPDFGPGEYELRDRRTGEMLKSLPTKESLRTAVSEYWMPHYEYQFTAIRLDKETT